MFREIESKRYIIKNFAPSWFAVVMGTGILSLTAYMYSSYITFLLYVSKVLFYLNVILFIVFLIPWILRWFLYRKDALGDLFHPVNSNFYPTFSVGMLVLASNFLVVGKMVLPALILWFCGAIITIFFALFIPFYIFKGEHVKIHHINPAWFIPPVGLIVIPIPGSILVNSLSGILHELAIILNIFGWGTGFFLYIVLLVICVYRFILHTPLQNILAPTIWINLGPIGAGTVSLFGLMGSTNMISVKEPFLFFGVLFWSFGIWWLIMAIAMTIYYIRRLSLPYAMSWWAFTFPLGAYVAATHKVSSFLGFKIIDYFGILLFCLLFSLWLVTACFTLKNAYSGRLFK
ncbi:C4-dicarboxylate ABC transporter [bacterium]|nr:MAG: C4-dicarboxylate ABC transporter [bacterium]